ncbi:hypothetical protein AgCh_033322 [Apium graveolens]
MFVLEGRKNKIYVDFLLTEPYCGDVEDNSKSWRFVGIYGWPEATNKLKTWNLMRHLCANVNTPIVIGGDFNEILSYAEKEGGVDTDKREIAQFREVIDDCYLRDLGFEGCWYTWVRGRTPETCVRERLDRVLCSSSWLALYPNIRVEHLVRYKSDHSALLVRFTLPARQKRKRTRFKFETCWLLDKSCEEVVKRAWDRTTGESLPEKINAVARGLEIWSFDKFDNLGKQIGEIEKALHLLQQQPISQVNCEEGAKLEKLLDDLHSKH